MNFKKHENKHKHYISTLNSVVFRLDGVGLHSRDNSKFIYSNDYYQAIRNLLLVLGSEVDGIRAIYVISDEINIILDKNSKFIMDNNKVTSKLTTKMASMVSVSISLFLGKPVYYDCRVLNVLDSALTEYLLQRASMGYNVFVQDLLKENLLSRKTHGLSIEEKIKMLENVNVNPDDIESYQKHGIARIFYAQEAIDERKLSGAGIWLVDEAIDTVI